MRSSSVVVASALCLAWVMGVGVLALAGEERAVSVDHRPKTEFDRLAVRAIGEGREMVDATEGGEYRYAGKVVLGNTCLKCHVPDRTSLEDRMAALVITMPLVLREPPAE